MAELVRITWTEAAEENGRYWPGLGHPVKGESVKCERSRADNLIALGYATEAKTKRAKKEGDDA